DRYEGGPADEPRPSGFASHCAAFVGALLGAGGGRGSGTAPDVAGQPSGSEPERCRARGAMALHQGWDGNPADLRADAARSGRRTAPHSLSVPAVQDATIDRATCMIGRGLTRIILPCFDPETLEDSGGPARPQGVGTPVALNRLR